MFRKNAKRTLKICNLLIISQMVFSPLALGQQISPKENKWQTAANVMQTLGSGLNSAVFAMQQAANNPQNRYNQYKASLDPMLKIQPINPAQIPPVFSGCLVLPAESNKVSEGMKCTAKSPQEIQAGYAAAMIEIHEFNLSQYDKYLTKGHARFSSQGVGCYEKKLEDFNGVLLAREEELNKYKERIKTLLDNFNLSAKNDLEGIKQTDAILNGEKGQKKYLKDFKFEDTLLGQNDSQNVCGSFLSSTLLSKTGQESGLKGIESQIFSLINKPNNKSMSADEMISKASQMRSEIDSLAQKMSSHMSNRSAASADLNSISYRGRIISKDNKALNSALSNFNARIQNQITDLESATKISNMTTGDQQLSKMFTGIQSGAIDASEINDYLANYERSVKFNCLTRGDLVKNFGSIESFAKRFKNPNISSSLANDADNALANSVVSILNNENLSIDQMINMIQNEESKGRNSRYIMTTGKTIKFNGRTINASTPMRPSQLVQIFGQSCKQDFESATNSAGYSKKDAVVALKNYTVQRKRIVDTASTDVAKIIKEELKSCPSDTSTGKAVLSCSNALNINHPNFCVRTALTCSGNMKGCYEKAKKQVETIRTQQNEMVTRFNQNVTKLKNNMKMELVALNRFLETQARSLDAQLNIGTVFETPAIDFNLAEEIFMGKKDGINSSLEIQDPKAYYEKIVKNLEETQKTLQKQRVAFLGNNGQGGKLGKMKNEYIQNYKKAKTYAQSMIQECQTAIANTGKLLKEQQDAFDERNAKLADACGDLMAFNENPASVEADELANDLSKVIQITASAPAGGQNLTQQDKAAIAKIRSFNNYCESTNENGDLILLGDKNSNIVTAANFCDNAEAVEMFSSYGARTLCNETTSSTNNICQNNDEFLEMTANYNFCFAGSNIIKTDAQGTGCSGGEEKDFVTDKIANASQIVKALKEDSIDVCYPEESLPTSSKEKREAIATMAKSFNCHTSRKEAGQIGVSVCGANSNSELMQKDIYQNLSRNIGSAAGTMLGTRR